MTTKTSIKISSLTKKRLAEHGYFNESYDVVISRLIDEVEINRKYKMSIELKDIREFLDSRIEEGSRIASRDPGYLEDLMRGYLDALHEVRGYLMEKEIEMEEDNKED